MKVLVAIIALLAITWLPDVVPQRINLHPAVDRNNQTRRIVRQSNADQMVQNILHWLDTVHGQGARKIRQDPLRTYLPPTESPRPFAPPQDSVPEMFPPQRPIYFDEPLVPQMQPQDQQYPHEFPPSPGEEPAANEVTAPETPSSQPSQVVPSVPSETEAPNAETPEPSFPIADSSSPPESEREEKKKRPPHIGYPPSGIRPVPSFTLPGTREESSEPTTELSVPIEPLPTDEENVIPPESTGYPPASETSEPNPPIVSPESTVFPPFEGPPSPEASEETPAPPSLPAEASTFPPILRETTKEPEETRQPETEAPSPPATSSPTEEQPTLPGISPTPPEVNNVTPPSEEKTNEPEETPMVPEVNPETSPQPTDTSSETTSLETSPSPDDLRHPPHIHAIDVECAKDMMTINIEFNRRFDGIVYSKGFYTNPNCRYVDENSGNTKYTFTLQLDSCGTQFINAFDTQNQSYLENVLVLQNEAGIQEVWDTVRAVRCLWEGSLKKSLTVSLSVGMLSEEIITFSGDTAVARLDIQRGEGPFAPSANGLVPIGEKMTLVISVTGDPGFDIQVKSCKAKSATGDLEYALTDDDGCVLRPKLFGAFQKTRNTGNTGASIIAYAFFYAFKFPDLMDLMMECNVELCKTDCEVCPNPDQKIEPGRRRRRNVYNETLGEPVTVGKLLRVLLPEDLSDGEALIEVKKEKELCVSVTSFTFASVLLISLLTCSILFSGYMVLKHRTISYKQQL